MTAKATVFLTNVVSYLCLFRILEASNFVKSIVFSEMRKVDMNIWNEEYNIKLKFLLVYKQKFLFEKQIILNAKRENNFLGSLNGTLLWRKSKLREYINNNGSGDDKNESEAQRWTFL